MTIFQYTSHIVEPIAVASKLGSGGEGTVYAVDGNPDICVKIYHEQKRTPELEAKLKAMIDAPPKDPTLAAGHYSICWPTNVVYEDEACTKFLGFTMPRIDKNTFKEYHLLCDKPGVTTSTCYRLEHFGTGFTYLHMYVVALNLASCVASIHNAGHAIGDLNDKNILVSTKDSKITIVDCDSFEIHAQDEKIFPCSVYMPEYSAPEVIQRKDIKNRQESDRFALSILIFKLLMLNTHPYASRGSSVEHLNTPGEKIAEGFYPYEEYTDLDVNPPAYALPYDIISPNIKVLFRRCFVDGQHEPEKRPSAMEWFRILSDYYVSMAKYIEVNGYMCKVNPLHIFPQLTGECLWCALDEDYFPNEFSNTYYSQELHYIEEMIMEFLLDNRISTEEYNRLLSTVEKKKIPVSRLNSLLVNKKKNSPSIVLGEEPRITPWFIDLRNFSEETGKKKYYLSITNNYFFEPIKVSIGCDPDIFLVNKSKDTINPNETISIELTLVTNSISKELTSNIGKVFITFESDRKCYVEVVTVIFEDNKPNTIKKIKKRNSTENDIVELVAFIILAGLCMGFVFLIAFYFLTRF